MDIKIRKMYYYVRWTNNNKLFERKGVVDSPFVINFCIIFAVASWQCQIFSWLDARHSVTINRHIFTTN